MFISCDACGYDSGDRSSNLQLADKVNNDGGHMLMTYNEDGNPTGWEILCPKRCGEQYIHLD